MSDLMFVGGAVGIRCKSQIVLCVNDPIAQIVRQSFEVRKGDQVANPSVVKSS